MKKVLYLMLFTSVFSVNALADCGCKGNKGGFVGDDVSPMSLEKVLKLQDDAQVVMEGKIIRKLGDEKYIFSDGKQEVVLEVDDDDWNGLTVKPEDKLLVKGEVDKEGEDLKVEVDSLSLVK